MGTAFLGSGWAFPPQFRRGGQVELVAAEADIRDSLLILLSTVPGERIMHPTFGCGLKTLVFENMSEGLATRIKALVARAVLLFEARVELEQVVVDAGQFHDGLLKIELIYRVRSSNHRNNLVFPFYLKGAAP